MAMKAESQTPAVARTGVFPMIQKVMGPTFPGPNIWQNNAKYDWQFEFLDETNIIFF